jgi:hypothetical protein
MKNNKNSQKIRDLESKKAALERQISSVTTTYNNAKQEYSALLSSTPHPRNRKTYEQDRDSLASIFYNAQKEVYALKDKLKDVETELGRLF